METRRAHPSRIERIPRMAAVTRPSVFFAGRPTTEWTSDSGAEGFTALVESRIAVDYGGSLVSHPRYYEAHERANKFDESRRGARDSSA